MAAVPLQGAELRLRVLFHRAHARVRPTRIANIASFPRYSRMPSASPSVRARIAAEARAVRRC